MVIEYKSCSKEVSTIFKLKNNAITSFICKNIMKERHIQHKYTSAIERVKDSLAYQKDRKNKLLSFNDDNSMWNEFYIIYLYGLQSKP